MRELGTLPEWSDAVVSVAAVADPDEPIALEALLLDRQHDEPAAPEKPAWERRAGSVRARSRNTSGTSCRCLPGRGKRLGHPEGSGFLGVVAAIIVAESGGVERTGAHGRRCR